MGCETKDPERACFSHTGAGVPLTSAPGGEHWLDGGPRSPRGRQGRNGGGRERGPGRCRAASQAASARVWETPQHTVSKFTARRPWEMPSLGLPLPLALETPFPAQRVALAPQGGHGDNGQLGSTWPTLFLQGPLPLLADSPASSSSGLAARASVWLLWGHLFLHSQPVTTATTTAMASTPRTLRTGRLPASRVSWAGPSGTLFLSPVNISTRKERPPRLRAGRQGLLAPKERALREGWSPSRRRAVSLKPQGWRRGFSTPGDTSPLPGATLLPILPARPVTPALLTVHTRRGAWQEPRSSWPFQFNSVFFQLRGWL
uniref:ICOS ligand isoform X1 n=1 Tax=Sus scrofa TaxID=9823 RepID=A0A480HWD1_PIG